MIRFYTLRILKDYLGHIILIGLPVALITLMVTLNRNVPGAPPVEEAARYIGLIYILMFQGFGAAYTFEGLEHDFYKPFKDRLLISPVPASRFVLATLGLSAAISFLQTLVLLFYIVLVYNVQFNSWISILGILALGVVFSQLLGAFVLLCFKKAAKAQLVMTLYIIIGMVLAGFFFPLPDNRFTLFARSYSSPLAWTHHALVGVLEQDNQAILLGVSLLSVAILCVAAGSAILSRRLTS